MLETILCAITIGFVIGIICSYIKSAPVSITTKILAYFIFIFINIPITIFIVDFIFYSPKFQYWSLIPMLIASFAAQTIYKFVTK